MTIGVFSVSLAVKDLQASKAFYESIGFTKKGGDETQNWLVLENGDSVIGLFQGMFEKNIMTYNPGWDSKTNTLENFEDVRDIQKRWKAAGIEFVQEADESTKGPASFIVNDPDGNPILVDQHV